MKIENKCHEITGQGYISRVGIDLDFFTDKIEFFLNFDYRGAELCMARYKFTDFAKLDALHSSFVQENMLTHECYFDKNTFRFLGKNIAFLALKITNDQCLSNHGKAMWLKKVDQTFFQGIENLPPVYKQAIIEGYEQTLLNRIMEILGENKQENGQEETEEERE